MSSTGPPPSTRTSPPSSTRCASALDVLVDDAPLPALRVVALEHATAEAAEAAALTTQANNQPWEAIAVALGLTEPDTRTRLRCYAGRYCASVGRPLSASRPTLRSTMVRATPTSRRLVLSARCCGPGANQGPHGVPDQPGWNRGAEGLSVGELKVTQTGLCLGVYMIICVMVAFR